VSPNRFFSPAALALAATLTACSPGADSSEPTGPGTGVEVTPTARPVTRGQSGYTLLDLGTFGGPASFFSGFVNGERILNDRGMIVGSAATSEADPHDPICFLPDCFLSHAFRWGGGVLTDLGAIAGANSSRANAINAHGWVAGFSEIGGINPLTGEPAGHAVLWRDGEMVDLGTLGGVQSAAIYVNNGGQVIGVATSNAVKDPFSFLGAALHPFLWQDGVMRDLGTLGGPDAIPASGCTNERNGLVAGTSFTNSTPNATTGSPTQHPFLWKNGRMLDLGTLGGTLASAQCANSGGQVIGQSNLAGDVEQHAFLWERGTMTDLGTLGGSFSVAFWLNDAGEAVGGATTSGDESFHASLWRNGVITDLGTLDGDCFSQAEAINSSSQIVGESFSCDFSVRRAVLWDHGSIVDLNTVIPANSSLQVAEGVNINDRGEIAGRAVPAGGPSDDQELDLFGHDVLLVSCGHGAGNCATHGQGTVTTTQSGPVPVTGNPRTSVAAHPTHRGIVAAWRARMARGHLVPDPRAWPRE
jgi:probable HAF family extracellular repeat protein